MKLSGLDRFLWALGFILNTTLFVVIWVRHRAKKLPVFTAIIGTNILRTIILFTTLRYAPGSYFITYWTLAFLDVVLQLAVAYDLARQVFRPLGAWAEDLRRSFLIAISLSLLFAGGLTWLAVPPTDTLRGAIIVRGDFFASVLVSELFVAVLALSVSLGLPLRTHVARTALGYGFYAFFGIITDGIHNYFGDRGEQDHYRLISHIQIEMYSVLLVFWIVTLWMNEPEPRKLPEELHEELRQLQKKAAQVLNSLRTMGRP